MPIDDTVNGGQANPRARKVRGAVQSLKRPEELFGIGHVKTRSVVADKMDGALTALLAPDFNPRRGHLSGELPAIADQVLQHHPHQSPVGVGCESILNVHLDLSARISFPQVSRHGAGDVGQIGAAAPELGAAHA